MIPCRESERQKAEGKRRVSESGGSESGKAEGCGQIAESRMLENEGTNRRSALESVKAVVRSQETEVRRRPESGVEESEVGFRKKG